MPEKADGNKLEDSSLSAKPKFEREITQTDKLNKRLLTSCLQFINSDKNNKFSFSEKPDNIVNENSEINDGFEQ